MLLRPPVDQIVVESPAFRNRVLVAFVEVVDEKLRWIVPLFAEVPERQEWCEDRLIADCDRAALDDIVFRIVTGEHQCVEPFPARLAIVVVAHAQLLATADHIHDILFQVKIGNPAYLLRTFFIFITEGDLVEVEDIFPAAGVFGDEENFPAGFAHPFLHLPEWAIAAVEGGAVTAEAVGAGLLQPLLDLIGIPFVELLVFPVEEISRIGGVIFAEPLRFFLEDRRSSLVFGHPPVDDVEEDPDVAFMRFVDEGFQRLPLFLAVGFADQSRTYRVDAEISVPVAAVERRRNPDSVDAGFREVVQNRDEVLNGSVLNGGIHSELHQNQAFDPFRRFGGAVGTPFHSNF